MRFWITGGELPATAEQGKKRTIHQASAMAAMETLSPGTLTGSFAPCRAGGFAGGRFHVAGHFLRRFVFASLECSRKPSRDVGRLESKRLRMWRRFRAAAQDKSETAVAQIQCVFGRWRHGGLFRHDSATVGKTRASAGTEVAALYWRTFQPRTFACGAPLTKRA